MFAAFDDSSAVVSPPELGSYGGRIRTMDASAGAASYERRLKLVSDNAARLLKLAAEADSTTRGGRDSLRFSLGSGMSWKVGHRAVSQAASKDGDVVVLFKGGFHVPPVHSPEDAHNAFVRGEDPSRYQNPCNAQRMLDYYLWSDGFRMAHGDQQPDPSFAVEKLRQLSGGFAFVLYDRKRHRLVVARDPAGAEELYWGVCSDGEEGGVLCISDALTCAAMGECMFSATQFPRGMVLISQGSVGWRSNTPGLACGPARPGGSQLLCFTSPERRVRAVPRINSSGAMCGAVFRVDSTATLAGAGAGGLAAMQRVHSSCKELVAL